MDIKTIEATIAAHDQLKAAVKRVADQKLLTKLTGEFKHPAHVAKYAEFQDFYLDEGMIHVDYKYYGSYSGRESFVIQPDEIQL